jgi:acylaminoacyl-peptidase
VRAAPGGAGNGDAGPVVALEVWGSSRLLAEVQVPRGLHGSVYADGWFGDGVAWSPNEELVAYVA